MSFLLRVSVSLLVLAGSLVENSLTAMSSNYMTENSGVWDSYPGAGGVWSSDGTARYYPVSTDHVTFSNQTITIHSQQAYGGVRTASTISNTTSLGNFMSWNSTLIQDAGGTLTFNGSGYTITTSTNGTFINNSTVSPSPSGSNNWYWRGTNVTFQNNNPLQFTGGSTWQMDSCSSTLTNTASGTIQSTSSGGTIFGNAVDRKLVKSGLVQTLGGTLSISAPTENNLGGTSAANNGTLNISGTLSNSGSQSAADPVNGNNLTLGSSTGVAAIPAQGQQFSGGKAAVQACIAGSVRQTDEN